MRSSARHARASRPPRYRTPPFGPQIESKILDQLRQAITTHLDPSAPALFNGPPSSNAWQTSPFMVRDLSDQFWLCTDAISPISHQYLVGRVRWSKDSSFDKLAGRPVEPLPNTVREKYVSSLMRLPRSWLIINDLPCLAVDLQQAQWLHSLIRPWGPPPPHFLERLRQKFPAYSDKIDQSLATDPWLVVLHGSIAPLQWLFDHAADTVDPPTHVEPRSESQRKNIAPFRLGRAPRNRLSVSLPILAILCVVIAFFGLCSIPSQKSTAFPNRKLPEATTSEPLDSQLAFDPADKDVPLELDVSQTLEPVLTVIPAEPPEVTFPNLPTELLSDSRPSFEGPLSNDANLVSSETMESEHAEQGSWEESVTLESSHFRKKFRVDAKYLGKQPHAILTVHCSEKVEPNASELIFTGRERKQLSLTLRDSDRSAKILLDISSRPGRIWEWEFFLYSAATSALPSIPIDSQSFQEVTLRVQARTAWMEKYHQSLLQNRETTPTIHRNAIFQEIRAMETQSKEWKKTERDWNRLVELIEELLPGFSLDIHFIERELYGNVNSSK